VIEKVPGSTCNQLSCVAREVEYYYQVTARNMAACTAVHEMRFVVIKFRALQLHVQSWSPLARSFLSLDIVSFEMNM
jgi:hypothetical protein